MHKHLAGRHNQQSHAGQSHLDAFTSVIQSLPINPSLGQPSVVSTNDKGSLFINFPNTQASIARYSDNNDVLVVDSDPMTTGIFAPNDIYGAVIDYAKQVGEKLGYKSLNIWVGNRAQIPVMTARNCSVSISDLNAPIRLWERRNSADIKARFRGELLSILRKRNSDKSYTEMLAIANKLITDDNAITNNVVPIDSLNLFTMYKITKALDAGSAISMELSIP